jgi:hypothetical protein
MRTLLISRALQPANSRGLAASLALAACLAGVTQPFGFRYTAGDAPMQFDKTPESAAADYLNRAFNIYEIQHVRLNTNQGLLQQLITRDAVLRAEVDIMLGNQRGQTKRACLVARARGWLLPGPRIVRTGAWQITPTLGGPCR